MTPIRVLIVEDHTIVRAGIRALLDRREDIQLVAEARDGREALEAIRTHGPDIVLLDISMPGLNGLEVAARVSQDYPGVRVIMLSMHQDEEYVIRALRAGAAGYLAKNAELEELHVAIRAVARGDTYLSARVSRRVIAEYVRHRATEVSPLEQLTPRQREILQLIAEGHTTQAIARVLGLSPKTVETHRASLMERLDIHDITGLVRYAIRMGLVTAEG